MEKIKNSVLKIVRSGQKKESSNLVLHDKRYVACDDGLHEIQNNILGDISFVDGGSALIVDSASFCLGKIRVVACCFDKNRKHARHVMFEAYVLCKYKDEETLFAEVEVIRDEFGFDVSLLEVSVAVNDDEFVSKMTSLSPCALFSKVRRLAELYAVHSLSGFVCLDGSLRWQDSLENNIISKIASRDVCGVCKTNSLISSDYHIMNMSQKGYKKIASGKGVPTLFMTKLHSLSKYTFIVESFGNISEQISHLACFCDDPRFYGYPYGLVKADKLARVSNREIEREKAKMRVLFKDDWNKVEEFMHTQDAHDILDKIA